MVKDLETARVERPGSPRAGEPRVRQADRAQPVPLFALKTAPGPADHQSAVRPGQGSDQPSHRSLIVLTPRRPTGPTGQGARPTPARAAAGAHPTYALASWAVVLLFVAAEVFLVLRAANGPFYDEGIYITAGTRTLEGYGVSDRYLTWFAGSLAWPALAGAGYLAAGLAGARLAALLCVTIAVLSVARATRNLFGDKAGFWTVATLALNGPLLALAHLAVYDVLALAGVGFSLWMITELARRDHRFYLVLAALAFGAGAIAKYPMLACGLPLAGLILALRGRQAPMDVAMFGFIVLALLVIYYEPWSGQLGAFVQWRVANNPTFGVTAAQIRYALAYFSLAPALLAALGWLVAKGQRRVASVLLGALAIWPGYHLLTLNPVGDHKHVVFGFLFGYPLIGLALATAWRTWPGRAAVGLLTVALALLGQVQLNHLDRAWPDVRPTARYLADRLHPGERLLINNSWPYTTYLYGQGRIASPWDVYDDYAVKFRGTPSIINQSPAGRQEPLDLCAFGWFVDEEGSYTWSADTLAAIAACGTFEEAFRTTGTVVSLGRDLDFVSYPVRTTVWRNVAPTGVGQVGEGTP